VKKDSRDGRKKLKKYQSSYLYSKKFRKVVIDQHLASYTFLTGKKKSDAMDIIEDTSNVIGYVNMLKHASNVKLLKMYSLKIPFDREVINRELIYVARDPQDGTVNNIIGELLYSYVKKNNIILYATEFIVSTVGNDSPLKLFFRTITDNDMSDVAIPPKTHYVTPFQSENIILKEILEVIEEIEGK